MIKFSRKERDYLTHLLEESAYYLQAELEDWLSTDEARTLETALRYKTLKKTIVFLNQELPNKYRLENNDE